MSNRITEAVKQLSISTTFPFVTGAGKIIHEIDLRKQAKVLGKMKLFGKVPCKNYPHQKATGVLSIPFVGAVATAALLQLRTWLY